MSFNLRIPNERDGENHFDNRKNTITAFIEKESPDLIGFQEAVDSSRAWLKSALGDRYTILGCGRGADYGGEGSPVAFKTDMFDLISFDTVWLSDTPNVPGSRFEDAGQSRHPRIFHKALLKVLASDTSVCLINLHFDHEGEKARIKSAEQLYGVAREISAPCFIMGDFNARPDSGEIGVMEKLFDIGWQEATRDSEGTYQAFGKRPPFKIDYIYTNAEITSAYAAESTLGGVYLSDHNAIIAEVDI